MRKPGQSRTYKANRKKRKPMNKEQRAANKLQLDSVKGKSIRAKYENELVAVTLRVSHCINSIPYGPGTVTLPRKLGDDLLLADARAVQHEEDLFQSYGVIIGPPVTRQGIATTRKVPVETFNNPIESIEPVNSKG